MSTQEPGNNRVNAVLERASIFATDNKHEYLTVEHILWSLLHEKDIQKMIAEAGGKPNIIRGEVETFINDNALVNPNATSETLPLETTSLRRVFQRALTQYIYHPKRGAKSRSILPEEEWRVPRHTY